MTPLPWAAKLAAKRAAACPVPIDYIGTGAQTLPADDASVDSLLSTWTLCTIPDASQALAEIRRVLRPGGALHFIEYGLAPDPAVARLQQRLTPIQHRAFGGCHFNRRIDQLVASAGFELTRMDTYYMKGPGRSGTSSKASRPRHNRRAFHCSSVRAQADHATVAIFGQPAQPEPRGR